MLDCELVPEPDSVDETVLEMVRLAVRDAVLLCDPLRVLEAEVVSVLVPELVCEDDSEDVTVLLWVRDAVDVMLDVPVDVRVELSVFDAVEVADDVRVDV